VDPVVLLGEYAEIKNRHDVEGMLRRTHRDCVYQEIGVDRVVTGLTELRDYHSRLFAALPDYTATVENIAGVEDSAVAWGRFGGVLAQPLFGHGRPGDRVDVAAVFVCQFRDGLLHRERAHIDLVSLRGQLSGPADRSVAS
jgi:steroid delta-isomerase-like uncharacterized protein